MTLKESVVYCLNNYFNFSGRGMRSEYWWFMLACTLAGVVGAIVDAITGRQILDPLISLASIIPTLTAASRRLHDTDKSGWWQLIAIIPLIGWILLIIWLARPGTPGVNRFGPPPVGATNWPVNAPGSA